MSGTVALSMDEAIRLALVSSPDARKAEAMLEQARGMALTSAIRPNPELGVDVENVGGNGAYRGFDSAETTYSLSQRIEIGGKRAARMRAAEAAGNMTRIDAELAKRDAVFAVKLAYLQTIATAQRLHDARKQAAWADKTLASVKRLYKNGGESQAQVAKAEALHEQSKLALAEAEIEATATRQQLASLLGKPEVSTEQLDVAMLVALPSLPAEAQPEDPLSLKRAQLDRTRAEANLSQQRRSAIPDPSIGVGFRNMRDTDSEALVFNVSVPLPVFDRNEGEIVKARAEVAIAEAELAKAERETRIRINRLRQNLAKNRNSADMLQAKVLPATEKSLADLERGYGQGRNNMLEVYDVARSLQETRQQYVNTLLEYHQNLAALERELPVTKGETR
ncbi:MAG TPA: TolC family protein [Alphaproteobacteria bacterium]|nr:TolC family protein [Alphaproteobacteria bacterium]